MAAPAEGLNPLRPYYIPPSIGKASEALPNTTTAQSNAGRSSTSSFSLEGLDYSDYLSDSSSSVGGSIRRVADQTLWRYATILFAQPAEVAKVMLQVYVAQDDLRASQSVVEQENKYQYREEYGQVDSDDEEPNFFTSSSPRRLSDLEYSPRRGRAGRPPRHQDGHPSSQNPCSPSTSSAYPLKLKNSHSAIDALSALSAQSGLFSLWRATNTTFIYSLLHRTLETFLRSLLSGILGLSESDLPPSTLSPSSTTLLTSASPLLSILSTVTSTLIPTLLLSPLDTARTRLILTPSSSPPRTLLATLRTLPSLLMPTHLLPITFLTSTLPTLLSTTTPLFLKSYFSLDPVLTPTAWSLGTLTFSAFDLALRWPLETVLRRAQIATWTAPRNSLPHSSSERKALATIVPAPQAYRGVVATVWGIVREEGVSGGVGGHGAVGKWKKGRKGQGVEGLYRGWRIGMLGLVGWWGSEFMSGQMGEPVPVGKKF